MGVQWYRVECVYLMARVAVLRDRMGRRRVGGMVLVGDLRCYWWK